MKKLYAFAVVGVDVTDEEYENLRKMAYEPRNLGNPYRDIVAPDWLMEKIKANGTFKGSGNIPSSVWR